MSSRPARDIYADTLAVFDRRTDPAEPLTTPEVADALDAERRTVYKRLRTLSERGSLETKSVGSNARVWWRPDETRFPSVDGTVPQDGVDGGGVGRPDRGRSNRLEAVVNWIGLVVARADDRDEIDRGVCERLVEFGPYRVATIGEVSPSFDRFDPRACAGAEKTALPPASPADSDRLAVTAAETGEVQVRRDLAGHPDPAWRRFAQERDVRAYAAVPLAYDGASYGVVELYADRIDAFDDNRPALAELGEIVGRALHDRGHREALDPAIELEFRSERLADWFLDVTDSTVTLTFDSAVPIADGTRLQYWTATGVTAREYRDAVRQMPTVVNTRLLSTVGDTVRFELRVAGRTFAAVFADHGGELQGAELRDGAMFVTGEFPHGIDAESVAEAAREASPDAEIVARRNVLSPTYLRGLLDDELTDRQSTVLRLAYFGGYFDQPRGSSGEELAEQLDITRQTFNHHLRAAESTLVRQLFERSAEATFD